MCKDKFYITTAIAYTSKIPHIGNVYEAIFADALTRYKKLQGYDTYFLTGTDEHGQKIQEQAENDGRTPQEHVDEIAGEIRRIWDMMNVSYDQFIRTTDQQHKKTVQKIFKKLYDNGDIYKGKYEGWYCVPDESFWTESQVEDGKCPECGRPVEKASEEAYFLKLSKYQERLEKHIEDNPDFIYPESRKNEMLNNFIKPGLQDLCVSRTSFNWGIPVEFDPGHVTYVWIDALSNYISAIGYDPEGASEKYKKLWPADIHIIGKDIVRFHTIYWPIILMGLGEPLPKQVFGHPWLLTGKDKMSKSRGNVIYADDLVELFGIDAVRYYVLREMPFAHDGTITYDMMISRINTDLANILGNLVNRTVSMSKKYFDGKIYAPKHVESVDESLIALALETPKKVSALMDGYKVADAIEAITELLRRTNKYIDETQPWVLAKDDNEKDRLAAVLYNLLESIRFSAVLLQAFIPDTADNIFKQIGSNTKDLASLNTFGSFKDGDTVGEASVLFARIDEAEKMKEIEALKAKNADPAEAPITYKPEIVYDDFDKIDLKVAKVLSCKKHPDADRLLVFSLKVGPDTKQVVSGIAEFYKPEALVGKHVIWVANLKPRKLRGVESNGMILSAEKAGKLSLLTADSDSGAQVS